MSHKFTYKHSTARHESSVTVEEDANVHEVVDAFVDYLIVAGFSRAVIEMSLAEYALANSNKDLPQ